MTEQNVVPIEEVRALVAERQRYDDWLTALEARRTETPTHVYDRVFSDYRARRSEVLSRLHDHVDGLEALSSQLAHRLGELETSLASQEDERMEAMLRTAVGEFDESRWQEVRARVEEQIESLTRERDGLVTEVDEVRTLLLSARPDPRAAGLASDTPHLVTAEGGGAETARGWASSASEPTGTHSVPVTYASPTALPVHTTQDELGGSGGASGKDHEDSTLRLDEANVFPQLAGMAQPSAIPSTEINLVSEIPLSNASSAGQGASRTYDDAMALFSDQASSVGPGFMNSLEGIEVEINSAAAAAMGLSAADVSTTAATPISNPSDPFDDLAFLQAVMDPGGAPSQGMSAAPTGGANRHQAGGEQQKTLRCTECGTMNLPTEWYCERCGGELAAF